MEESDVTTWLFEEGTFIPAVKIVGDKSYSIITDYLGTSTEMYNSNGEKTWSVELDIYGSVRNFAGRSLSVPLSFLMLTGKAGQASQLFIQKDNIAFLVDIAGQVGQ